MVEKRDERKTLRTLTSDKDEVRWDKYSGVEGGRDDG